jgi:hypothetical protein
MDIAASRRDPCATIRQRGVRSDGPGSAEHDRKGMGSVSVRKHRDCFAYVLATNLHHRAVDQTCVPALKMSRSRDDQ